MKLSELNVSQLWPILQMTKDAHVETTVSELLIEKEKLSYIQLKYLAINAKIERVTVKAVERMMRIKLVNHTDLYEIVEKSKFDFVKRLAARELISLAGERDEFLISIAISDIDQSIAELAYSEYEFIHTGIPNDVLVNLIINAHFKSISHIAMRALAFKEEICEESLVLIALSNKADITIVHQAAKLITENEDVSFEALSLVSTQGRDEKCRELAKNVLQSEPWKYVFSFF